MLLRKDTLLTVAGCSFSGLLRVRTIRLLIAGFLVIPLLGFLVSHPAANADPAMAFLEFQFGFQRMAMIVAGLAILYRLVADDQNVGTQTAMRAAGVTSTHYVLGKWITLLAVIAVWQLLSSLYGWMIVRFWMPDGGPEVNGSLAAFTSLGFHLQFALLNWLAVAVVAALTHFLWILFSESMPAYVASVAIWVAGTLHPVWYSFFTAEAQGGILKVLGMLIGVVIPGFYRFDWWLMQTEYELSSPVFHLFLKLLQTLILVSVLLFASCRVASLKRT